MQSVKPAAKAKVPQNDNVALKDAKLVYRACSMAFAQSVGCASPSEVIGRTDFDLLPKAVAQQQRALDVQALRSAKSDINTIRLGGRNTSVADAASAMIVRNPILADGNVVCGIDIRLVGGTSLNKSQGAPQVDYAELMREGRHGSIIISDNAVLFATEAAAETLGYRSAERLQSTAQLNDIFTPEQRIHLSRAALAESADPGRITRARVTARRRDGNGVTLITRAALVTWASAPAILLSFIEFNGSADASIQAGSTAKVQKPSKIASAIASSTKPAQAATVSSKTAATAATAAATTGTQSSTNSPSLATVAQRYHDFVKATADCFWEMDERLVFRMVSNQSAKVLGIENNHLVGRTFQQWLEMPANVNDASQWAARRALFVTAACRCTTPPINLKVIGQQSAMSPVRRAW